jgi:hypothetical protein
VLIFVVRFQRLKHGSGKEASGRERGSEMRRSKGPVRRGDDGKRLERVEKQ